MPKSNNDDSGHTWVDTNGPESGGTGYIPVNSETDYHTVSNGVTQTENDEDTNLNPGEVSG